MHRLMTLYQVKDRAYGVFHTWETHQGRPRAKKSKYPDIPQESQILQTSVHNSMQMQTIVHNSYAGPDSDSDLSCSSLSSLRKGEAEKDSEGGEAERNFKTEAAMVLQFLNEKTGRAFRPKEGSGRLSVHMEFIMARLKSGVDVQTCKSLIARKVREWKGDPKTEKWLSPETLFNRTKFEKYLAEVT
ncbi:MAG: conserved phage C-terminal domain-containing protein [Nitrospiraceae bacterium]